MSENSIRVASAVADKKQVILYLDNGEQLVVKQGDHRLGDLLDVIIPITTRGEIAVVSLDDFSVYAAFEKKTDGMTKFFRIAKNKVKGFFGGNTDTHITNIPPDGRQAILNAVRGESMSEEEVLTHGKPIDATDTIPPDEVVVAVVTDPLTQTKKVIPGAQNLMPLISHAVKTNSTDAVQAFLNRCAAFIDQRQHSVDDLMRFLEKGDLPLAEDGSIIAYKMLNYLPGDPTKTTFVDCHSGKVPQKVGSYVCVNENLVDLDRRTECSNGLHIARRGYLSSFGGNVCVLCKIDPEDVMVVPHNDANKVRVKGYHILGVLPDEATKFLKIGKAMTGEETALQMVYDAIKGNHVERIERVQVNGQLGTNVIITKIRHTKESTASTSNTGEELKRAAALDDEVNVVGAIDPREINKRVTEALSHTVEVSTSPVSDGLHAMMDEETPTPNTAEVTMPQLAEVLPSTTVPAAGVAKAPTNADQARAFYRAWQADNSRQNLEKLLSFKKSAKKGWSVLGFSDQEIMVIKQAI